MSDIWLNFTVIFFAELLVLLIHAYYEKRLPDVPRILWLGLLCSIVPGPLADLFGTYLGLGWYTLGVGPFSLALNAIFLYSIFAANTLLMQKARFVHFCAWTFLFVAVVEVTNLFFPIWTYTLTVPSIEYFVVAFGAPLGLALATALAVHRLFGYRFAFISDPLKHRF